MPANALLCLPFAGGGAAFFRAWPESEVTDFDIVPLQLPGHEERFLDDLVYTVAEAVEDLAPTALEATAGHDAILLFGHSLGAVLAYELGKRLAAQNRPVRHLLVSGSPGPREVRARRAVGLDDDAFLERVREFAGYDHGALHHEELRELLLPAMRADVMMHEDYRAAESVLLDFPVTSIRGADDMLVSAQQASQWRAVTAGPFAMVTMPGGHMYLVESAKQILDLVGVHCV